MLVKTNNKIRINEVSTIISDSHEYSSTGYNWVTILEYQNTIGEEIYIPQITLDVKVSAWNYNNIKVFIDEEEIIRDQVNNTSYTTRNYYPNRAIQKWQTLRIQIAWNQNSNYTIRAKNIRVYWNPWSKDNTTAVSWYPTSPKQLWDLWVFFFFWISNWVVNFWQETTEYTTWNITPWNCVWFLQIWKYKIPYYL